jgi:hypothetical protein
MVYEGKYLILIALLAGILLIAPQAVRMLNHNNSMINSEAYYNLRIYNQEDTNYDFLQGHSIPLNIINILKVHNGAVNIIFSILPILLGMITIILAYLILRRQNIPGKTTLAIITLMTISPIFIYTFTDFKMQAFIMFLNTLGLYLLMHDKTLLSSIPFAIIPFIDTFSGIITLGLLLTYMFSSQRHRIGCKIASIALLAAIILSLILNIYYRYMPKLLFQFGLQNVLTDIGADVGISFSIIILTVIGLILLWENGWKNLVIYGILIAFMMAGLFNTTIRIYMNFIIMIYAGFAFVYLNKRKWSIGIIKKTTTLLIICSIFFSTLVYMTGIIRSEPTPEYIDALEFLKSQSLPTEVILSSPKNGYFIEYYTERMAFVDGLTKYYDAERYNGLDIIANSRNLERTEDMLQKYNIKYILIDDNFEPYLKEKEGLLFLIENSKKFASIYRNNRVEVWMYTTPET